MEKVVSTPDMRPRPLQGSSLKVSDTSAKSRYLLDLLAAKYGVTEDEAMELALWELYKKWNEHPVLAKPKANDR
jgi:hypothetical protein